MLVSYVFLSLFVFSLSFSFCLFISLFVFVSRDLSSCNMLSFFLYFLDFLALFSPCEFICLNMYLWILFPQVTFLTIPQSHHPSFHLSFFLCFFFSRISPTFLVRLRSFLLSSISIPLPYRPLQRPSSPSLPSLLLPSLLYLLLRSLLLPVSSPPPTPLRGRDALSRLSISVFFPLSLLRPADSQDARLYGTLAICSPACGRADAGCCGAGGGGAMGFAVAETLKEIFLFGFIHLSKLRQKLIWICSPLIVLAHTHTYARPTLAHSHSLTQFTSSMDTHRNTRTWWNPCNSLELEVSTWKLSSSSLLLGVFATLFP